MDKNIKSKRVGERKCNKLARENRRPLKTGGS